jgi:hypothetical protein
VNKEDERGGLRIEESRLHKASLNPSAWTHHEVIVLSRAASSASCCSAIAGLVAQLLALFHEAETTRLAVTPNAVSAAAIPTVNGVARATAARLPQVPGTGAGPVLGIAGNGSCGRQLKPRAPPRVL